MLVYIISNLMCCLCSVPTRRHVQKTDEHLSKFIGWVEWSEAHAQKFQIRDTLSFTNNILSTPSVIDVHAKSYPFTLSAVDAVSDA